MIYYFAFLLIFVSGCTTVPNPARLPIHPPKKTRSGLLVVNHTQDLSQLKWWEKMHDPVLNRLIKQALAKNNQIKNAQSNILQAQAQLQAAHFAWIPTLKASGNGFTGGTWDNQLTPKGTLLKLAPALGQTGLAHFRGYYGGFAPDYSLNILKNLNADKLARATLGIQVATYQSTRLTIISQIAGSYFMLLGEVEQEKLQTKLIRDLKKSRQLEWDRYKDGGSDLSKVVQIDKQLANNKAALSSIKNSIAQVENALQVLLNRNPGPLRSQGTIHQLSMKGLIPPNLPSSVLKHRPDVIVAKENLKVTLANLGIAYSEFFPNISLTGLLSKASLDLERLLNLSTGLWIADIAASMPIFNGANYEQVQAAKAGVQAAYFNYAQTLRQVFSDVDNSLTNQQKMNEAYIYQLEALQAAQKSYALALAKYQAGAEDYREVMNAAITKDNAKLDLNTAKIQQLDAIVGVYQSLAGGYCG